MDILVVHIFNALLYASVLFLIAGGLSLIYGVMRIVNLAHGNLFAVGAFLTASAVGQWFAGSESAALYLLLPIGALGAAAIGAVLEPTLLRRFYRRREEYQLLVTFGLLMILEDLMRFIWGPYPISATVLFSKLGSEKVGDFVYPRYNLLVIAVGFLAALFLWAFIYRTKFGVVLRATSQNMRMAAALGVNVNVVYVEAFTIGCFMAGLGGAIIVPSQSAVLGMGVDALVLSFIVVVTGGLGSLVGALVGALIVGTIREIGISLFPEIELAVLYLIAAIVLLVRPAGLFGKTA
ncbi:MAG TPA: branched-chain amino acid ABC transporter permease [Haliangiales bacterium]|nr:branched-chain amino acid ABC transporter permease [Haliangiales bacterium]